MGNHSSRSHPQHPPATWTQSFPRDTRRMHKMGVTAGERVLPERVPVQRLRPTENGRSLQVAGTITGRRAIQHNESHPGGPIHLVGPQSLPGYATPNSPPCPAHPNGPPAPLHTVHSTSLTHLHQPCVLHPSPGGRNHSKSGSMHELRFGLPPSKTYTSEPDLRGAGPTVPIPANHSPHTIISQSPTKGRIKSKKRNKAPPPPLNGALSDGYVTEHSRTNSDNPRAVHWGTSDTQSRPSSQVSSSRSKSKSRKIGLFKKKHDGRKSDNESPCTENQSRFKYKKSPSIERSKEEVQERARSVDCLQHELRRGSPLLPPTGKTDLAGRGSSSDESRASNDNENRRRSQTIERDSRRVGKDDIDNRLSITMERNPRTRSRESISRNEDYKLHSKLEERRSYDLKVPPNYMSRPFAGTSSPYEGQYGKEKPVLERRASSSTARCERIPLSRAFEEWEEAEKEVLNRKRLSENMKRELLEVAKNLKKSSAESPEGKPNERSSEGASSGKKEDNPILPSVAQLSSPGENDVPRTFFFGMEPGKTDGSSNLKNEHSKTAHEEVRIEGATVEYSKRNADVIEQSRIKRRANISGLSNQSDKTPSTRVISNDVDESAIVVERRKLNFVPDDIFSNSLRREDGGYHSRQNSGSFHLENENPSDEDPGITANLRPVLPKRQREIPRFSPNAAWRFLGEEPTIADENLNESRSSEEVDTVFEDRIRGYSRPVAPPRGSGEKSADSGISGDAGSPGPMPEFEPIIPTNHIKVNGPLAASSPVTSGRSDARRAWTPAQDLDDNSLDGSGDLPGNRGAVKGSILSSPPKFTTRANMFTLFGLKEGKVFNENESSDDLRNATKSTTLNATVEESTQTTNNFRKIKRSVSGSINVANNSIVTLGEDVQDSNTRIDGRNVQSNKWRDNWSMTRSIPNSLNNIEDSVAAKKNFSKIHISSNDTSHPSYRQLNREEDPRSVEPLRRSTNSYLQNSQTGHIMYLPEYDSQKVLAEESISGEIRSKDLNSSKHLHRSYTPDQRKSVTSHEDSCNTSDSNGPTSLPFFAGCSPMNGRMKKGKKFSYQSTVRVLEKKIIEEKLNREVAAKEQQRLQEAAAMMQVEEEFQLKREREKKRLKQQLKMYQAMQNVENRNISEESPIHERNGFLNCPSDDEGHCESESHAAITIKTNLEYPKQNLSNPIASSKNSRDVSTGFQPLLKENDQNNHSRLYSFGESKDLSSKPSVTNEGCHSKGYMKRYGGNETDAAGDVTIRTVPRDDPDMGSSQRCSGDDACSTVSSVSGQSHSTDGRKSHRRPAPDGAPAEGRNSPILRVGGITAARQRSGLMTQELPEHQLPRREYREYRRSQRPHSGQGGISDNYRRDFSRGQVQVALQEDRSSRHSSDGRRSVDGHYPVTATSFARHPSSDLLETASSCSSAATSSRHRGVGGVKTHLVRTTRVVGLHQQPQTHLTKYFEHPPVMVGSMGGSGRPASPYQFGSEGGAINRHVTPKYISSAHRSPGTYSPTHTANPLRA